jgi:hypothetical protein
MKWTKKHSQQLMLRQIHSIVFSNFPDLEEFLDNTEHLLKLEQRSIRKRAKDEITDGLSQVVPASILEDYAVQLGQFEVAFPQILRFSLFISLMATLEDSIVTLCHGVRQVFDVKESFSQRGPNVMDRPIKYLRKHASIDTNGYEDLIIFVDELRNIRNCIVHSNGRVGWRKKEEEMALRNFIQCTPTIEINSYGKIVMLEGFIGNSANVAKSLIQKLFESIRKALHETNSEVIGIKPSKLD